MIRTLFIFFMSLIFTFPAVAGWTDWVNLGGAGTSDPAACTAGNLTYVFVRNGSKQLSYRRRYLPSGLWTPWIKAPVLHDGNYKLEVGGAPAVACYHNPKYDSILISVVGNDRHVWSLTAFVNSPNGNDTFGDWYINDGVTPLYGSAPALAIWNGSQTHYFVRGNDGRTYVKNRLLPFELLVSEPVFRYHDQAAVWGTKDRLDFFYCDQQDRLWQRYKIGNTWSTGSQIPLVCQTSVEAISRSTNSLELFTVGPDQTIWHKQSVNNVWGPWETLGGSPVYGPAATVYANSTRMMLFTVWLGNGNVRYRAWAP